VSKHSPPKHAPCRLDGERPPYVLLQNLSRHLAVIESAMEFLRGLDPTLAHRIASRSMLPEGPRFAALERFEASEDDRDPLGWAFGALGTHDRARQLRRRWTISPM
jgi:hypothetical protein